MYAIEASNLSKNYPSFKLGDLNLTIKKGEITGLIGENGAGKTTLISLILNQIKRDSGKISIFGLDNIGKEIKIKQQIGFVVDECCFPNCLSPQNIDFIMKSIYAAWESSFFYELLGKLQIDKKKKISMMSKGMKSKLLLTVAMAHKPPLLILDEVTSGLDPVIRDDIVFMLKKYVAENNATIFFSTHITSDLDKVADNAILIHDGQIVFNESIRILNEKYLIIKESKKIHELENDKILSYSKEGIHFYLMHSKSDIIKKYGTASVPTLDEIMLMHIRGA